MKVMASNPCYLLKSFLLYPFQGIFKFFSNFCRHNYDLSIYRIFFKDLIFACFLSFAQPFCNSLSEAGLETGGQLEICWRRQSIPWWLILPITTSLSWFLQETNWPCGFLPSRDVCLVEDLGPNLR